MNNRDFTEYLEIHFEIVDYIMSNDLDEGVTHKYELAKSLTDKFVEKYKDVVWGEELEFFDELDKFLEEEL